MKSKVLDLFKTFFFYLTACIAIFLMSKSIAQYSGFRTDIGFLKVKQEYLPITLWRWAFYTHVFTSLFCLLAVVTQFSKYVKTQLPQVHRIMGRIYVFNILLINFPAALIMAYYANGGITSIVAFFILDILWFGFTLKAFLEIRKGNVLSHKNFMIRSYALTFSAITLRTWKIILTATTDLDEMTIYMIDARLGFVPNLVVAEILIWWKGH